MGKSFKYKAKFTSEIVGSSSFSESSISNASLDELSSLAPDLNFDANIDLLAVAFNAAVVNKFNKNHDGINTETALAVSDYFIHKPTNIEHKKEKVVGHIVSSAFSKYGTNELIEPSELKDETGPFNIALGAVVYKVVNKDFANLVEKSADKNDEMYGAVSASWEIGFNDYLIAVGSKNLNEAEIIEDPDQIEEMKSYLKAFGGEGRTKDGSEIYRLVSGDVYPLGIGFTANPAADVKGIYLNDDKKKEEETEEINSEYLEKIEVNTEDFLKKIKNYKKNVSHIEKTHVISDKAKKYSNSKIMEMKDLIKELKETIEASTSDKFSEEAVANIAKVVSDAIRERSDSFVKEKAELEAQKEDVAKAKEEADQKLKELEEQLAASQTKLSEIEAEQKAAKSIQVFNNRMEALDSSYELTDEDRKIIAEDLKNVEETEEAFASYQERMSVIYKHKSKEFLAEQEKAFNEKVEAEVLKKIEASSTETTESTEEVVEEDVTEEALDNVEASSEEIPSNNGESIEQELSLRDKFQQAFNKESITIKY